MPDMDLHVAEDIREASTLPAEFYKDPAMHQRVLQRVFEPSWQFVADVDSVRVPGAVYPTIVLDGAVDEPIVFTRDNRDQLHCVSNVCTHRGMLVAESPGNERFLRCRYPGRRFGLDGKFQHMPEFEDVCGFPTEADHLPQVPFVEWTRLLFASVAPHASFEEVFGPMISRVSWMPIDQFYPEPSRGREYLVRANWALYVDNYLEGFHIPFIHAGLNETLDYENYHSELHPWLNLQLAEGKTSEACFQLPPESPEYGKNISAYYFWVFPNLMFNFYPWGLSINIVRPLGPELTKVQFIPYVWDASKMSEGAGAALDRVEREDEVVVEAVQRGVKSRFYDRGRFSPRREINTHHFHRLLSAAFTESDAA